MGFSFCLLGNHFPEKPSCLCAYGAENINFMLLLIAFILIVLWLLGLITSFTLSGFIYILLVIAVILVLVRIIQALLG
jgi:Family of unknown function (DUF5670)